MTYRKDKLIVAADFNSFRLSALNIFNVGFGDAGYGQIAFGGATPLPPVVIDQVVTSPEWQLLTQVIDECALHQDSTIFTPPLSELAVDELIEAHEFSDGNAYDFDASLLVITNNRLNWGPASTTIFANALQSVRNVAWSSQIQHRYTATFSTVDGARYFFNSGGEIHNRASRSGGDPTSQNASWTNMLANMGTIVMNHTSTFQTGGAGSGTTINNPNVGYYDLSTSFIRLATGVPVGDGYGGFGGYTGNQWTLDARTVDGPGGVNGDNGRQIEFLMTYTDGHTSPWSDVINGTITSDIDYRKATSPLTIPTPVFVTSVPLTAGS